MPLFFQSGFIKAGFLVLFFIILIVGIAVWKQNRANTQPESTPAPSAELSISATPGTFTVVDKVVKSPTPTSSTKPTATLTPTPSPTLPVNTGSSSEATVYVDTSCAADHDGLGKHMDATITFKNLDKLNSKDLVVSVIDTTTQHRSESHVDVGLINNTSIPAHKYAYAYQGSTVPLELVADGRDFLVRIMKANYKADGSIDVYVQALETKFAKKCDF